MVMVDVILVVVRLIANGGSDDCDSDHGCDCDE